MHLFEGSEKKLEVIIDRNGIDLRALGLSFWTSIVEASAAEIISCISSQDCDAYLLSESSLFVWPDRFTMITCGQTKLIDAATLFIKQAPYPIASLFFQRKNELFPQMQHTNFEEDVRMLQGLLGGEIYHFGEQHYNHIFHYEASTLLENKYYAQEDTTIELLMYNLGAKASAIFLDQTQEKIHTLLSKTNLFSYFETDEFLFEPFGYSVNGLKDGYYFTIHVTPQEECSYTSFETNVPVHQATTIIQELVQALEPKHFDTVVFCDQPYAPIIPSHVPLQEAATKRLGDKYYVHFSHHGETQ